MLEFDRFIGIGLILVLIGSVFFAEADYIFGIISAGSGWFIGCFGIFTKHIERNSKSEVENEMS